MTSERWLAGAVAIGLLTGLLAYLHRARVLQTVPLYTVTAFLAIWSLTLGLFAIPLITYTPTGAGVWALIYGSIVTFLIGAWAAHRVTVRHGTTSSPEILSAKRLHAAWLVTGALSIVGFALFVRAIEATVGWETLLESPSLARSVQRTSAFEDVYSAGRPLSYLGAASLLLWSLALRERHFTGRWRFIAPLELLVLVPYLFLGERLSFLAALAWIATFHLVWRPLRARRVVVLGGIALTSVALVYFYAIGYHKDSTLAAHPEIRREVSVSQLENLALPYLYSTANIPVFARLTDDPLAPTTYGQLSVLPLVKAGYRLLPLEGAPPEYGGFYPIPFESYNSATWLGPFFRDFGVVGCIVLPGVVGFFTTMIVIVGRIRRTFLSAWLGALGLSLILFSPLKNQLQDAVTWELVVAGLLGGVLLPQRDQRGALPSRMRVLQRRPVAVAVVGASALAAVVGVAALVRGPMNAPSAQSASRVSERLDEAARRAMRAQEVQGRLSSLALASQLQVSDSATQYEPVPSESATPSAPGTVGVHASRESFRLGAVTARDETLEVIGVRRGSAYRQVGPRRRADPELVDNEGFEDEIAPAWFVSGGDGVEAKRTESAYAGAFALQLQYVGGTHSEPSAVTQVVRKLTRRDAGTRYQLKEIVARRRLSRQVSLGFQYLYRDGTSQYIGGGLRQSRSQTRSQPTGVLAGTSRGWEVITASGTATKRIAGIRIFAIDAGRKPLRGRIRIDNVTLVPQGP